MLRTAVEQQRRKGTNGAKPSERVKDRAHGIVLGFVLGSHWKTKDRGGAGVRVFLTQALKAALLLGLVANLLPLLDRLSSSGVTFFGAGVEFRHNSRHRVLNCHGLLRRLGNLAPQ